MDEGIELHSFYLASSVLSFFLVSAYISSAYVGVQGPTGDHALDWWNAHRDTFPRLYILGKKYLCVPPTQATEERHISAAELNYSDLRQSLKPETLNQILLLKLNRDLWAQ